MGLAAANGMQKGKHCVQSSFKASQMMLTEVVVLPFNHLRVWGIVAVIEWGIPMKTRHLVDFTIILDGRNDVPYVPWSKPKAWQMAFRNHLTI